MLEKVKVSICCITYNQVEFIEETINGFLSQNVDFIYEILIYDDASNDGTSDIILEYANRYPEIIFPIIQTENQYSKGIRNITIRYNVTRARGEYTAICEGDDYWSDPLKLAKQVDILDSNEGIGLVYSKAKILLQDKKSFAQVTTGKKIGKNGLLFENVIPTLTTIFRTKLIFKFLNEIRPYERGWLIGDYPIWIWFYFNTGISFLNEITSVYRYRIESTSQSLNKMKRLSFHKSVFEIANFFAIKYLTKQKYLYFLEARYRFLYLFCLKNGLADSDYYYKELNALSRKSLKTRILINMFRFNFIKKAFSNNLKSNNA